ncbi:hypothetical protein [Cellulomonas sp.]|uniref:hypothetical protein n=1 Tax=Cellulomonas sp. TaxID=40001 RepID=UPI00258993A8|nr:hypothetical protein [Cellulomonas sp.]MCR6687912.1 hypothetical protein [Cellulomonas sp.]
MAAPPGRRPRRRRRTTRTLLVLTLLTALLAAGVGAVVVALDRVSPEPVVAASCAATVDGTSWHLSPDQAQNAALFAGMAARRGLPARAVTIAIATALQESRMENIDYGDRDSIGLFQQRPSQGWGTVEQIMNPTYATRKFFEGLEKVDGYEDMEITVAAQAVQRSGFPDAYAQHEGRARAWASALTGHSPGALTCTLDDAPGPADPAAARDRAQRDWGDTVRARVREASDDAPAGLDLTAVAADAALGAQSLAAWAVATADVLGAQQVSVGDRTWDRESGEWSAVERPLGTGQVRVTFAG